MTVKNDSQVHDFSLGGRGANSFRESSQLHARWTQQREGSKGYADPGHPFRHQGSADLNTYKLFLELAHGVLHQQGRLGFVVPSGIYTDKGTTNLRKLFLDYCDWQWLFGFENREGIFDIHRSFKFCPLILEKGGKTQAIRAAFMHRDVDDWEHGERYVLAYPRDRVEQFSPYSLAILEIRSEHDLAVLTKLYANGVLLGDQSSRGWGITYAREFDMTNDSNLFPGREKWEAKGYVADEYGHWLKGAWREYDGPRSILERKQGFILSRDGRLALAAEDIEDVSLPLYEGRMIGQFDFSEKGWVSGKGRSAIWREVPFEEKLIEPQYLMGVSDFLEKTDRDGNRKSKLGVKVGFLAVGSATNSRSMFAGLMLNSPAGNAVPVLQTAKTARSFGLMAIMNSYVYDYVLRNRLGGLNLNYFVLAETLLASLEYKEAIARLGVLATSLAAPSTMFSEIWDQHPDKSQAWRSRWAITRFERLRLKSICEAIAAESLGLSYSEFHHVLAEVDFPVQFVTQVGSSLNPKGFWRMAKDQDPELRHTVLSLVAFRDLKEVGLEAFLSQNNEEGWMIPETLRLADYGLGHDDRAKEHQPVAGRLGPRFYDWQLEQDLVESWEECRRHAELIRQIVPPPVDVSKTGVGEPTEQYQASLDL